MNIKSLLLLVAIAGVLAQPLKANQDEYDWENGGTIHVHQDENTSSENQGSSWLYSPITWAGALSTFAIVAVAYAKSRAEGAPTLPATMAAAASQRLLDPAPLIELMKQAAKMAHLTMHDDGSMPGWKRTSEASQNLYLTTLRGLVEKQGQ